LTGGDLERIAGFAGRSDFWEFRRPENPDYLDQDDDPNWLHYTLRSDGTRRVLKRGASGDCGFLTATGCRLPVSVRPLICLLHPFTYTEKGIDGTGSDCPSHLLPEGETLLESLSMNPAQGEEWRARLYSELRKGVRVAL